MQSARDAKPKISTDRLNTLWLAELKSVTSCVGVEKVTIPAIKEAVQEAKIIFDREITAGKSKLGRGYQIAVKKLQLTLLCEHSIEQFTKEINEKILKRQLIITPEIQSTVIDPLYKNKRIIAMASHGLIYGIHTAIGAKTLTEARQNFAVDLAELEHLLKTAPEINAIHFYEKERKEIIEVLNLKSAAEIPAVINLQLNRLKILHHRYLLLEQAPAEEQNGSAECLASYAAATKELDEQVEYFKQRPQALAKLNGSAFFKGAQKGEKVSSPIARDISKLSG